MSVLIKGMEMPTSCDDCEFCKHAISGYDWCCIPMVNGRSKPLDEPVIKPDWCPLVHVPPHGRLIDADELAEDLDFDVENDLRALDSLDIVGKERKHIQFDKSCKQNCMWYLINCPTIIPAEGKEADA